MMGEPQDEEDETLFFIHTWEADIFGKFDDVYPEKVFGPRFRTVFNDVALTWEPRIVGSLQQVAMRVEVFPVDEGVQTPETLEGNIHCATGLLNNVPRITNKGLFSTCATSF